MLLQLPGLSEEVRERLDRATQRIVNRLLHNPSTNIKKVVRQRDGAFSLGLIAELFGLEEEKKEDT